LPHINTFPDYRPHVTLAYVRKGWYDEHADSLRDKRPVFHTKGLDYGKMKS
jgi:2'-5' RNA ligase